MALSIFDLFKIGIGPSSSHTVGPMKAARRFALQLQRDGRLTATARVVVHLCGSLGHTGRGHGSDRAVLLGLLGEEPETVDPETIPQLLESVSGGKIRLLGRHAVALDPRRDLIFHKRRQMPEHPNGMRFEAFDADGTELAGTVYYSVGGGFVLEPDAPPGARIVTDATTLAHPFASAAQLLDLCRENGASIAAIVRANEHAWRNDEDIDRGLLRLWGAMQTCAARGIAAEGELPGGLHVPRRAPALHRHLLAAHGDTPTDPLAVLDWVDLYALAVNEENAAGGRVVTAPTNGAAGVIPAVLHYYTRFVPAADERGVIDFLLTAGAIGMLYKENASISGADVGCQGEVGVACSMAAGALTAVLGGTPAQIENAAEIGMEHNLGLTCDPIGGLVQIPCIERNAMAAVKAINAARIALRGDGSHHVSLDRVIRTMLATGRDMKDKYKETSRGGLAVNLIEC
jgi:L-serine dehydratase